MGLTSIPLDVAQRHATGSETQEMTQHASRACDAPSAPLSASETVAQWYADYYAVVFKNLLFRLGRERDARQMAEDMTHDTFARALAALREGRFDGRKPKTWLLTIAVNLMRDYYRSKGSRKVAWDSEHHDHLLTVKRADEPEHHVIAAEELAAFDRAWSHLTERQQEAMLLRGYAGLSVSEVGAHFGIKRDGVKGLLDRARSTLRDHLAEVA